MKNVMETALRHHRRGDLGKAEQLYRRILKKNPREPDALHLLGCIELKKNNRDQAVRLMQRAIALAPHVALYHENLAEAHHRSGDLDRAESACRLALRLDAKRPAALNRLGVIAIERQLYEDARGFFSDSLRVKADNPETLINMATAMNRMGDFDFAIQSCDLALKLQPDNALAHNNRGQALRGLGRRDEARAAFRRAEAFPMARYNLGYMELLDGNLLEGLALGESRLKWANPGKALRQPEWKGRSHPHERLVVLREQGMGDTILMARFVPQLLDHFQEVVFQVPPPLQRLMETVDSRIRVVSELDGVSFDRWTTTMSLPFRLGIDSVQAIPLEPWIPRPESSAPGGLSGLGITAPRLRVGVNWAGNPRFHYDRVRSTTLDTLGPLLELPGIEWVSLHKGAREAEADRLRLPQPLAQAVDFLDTAKVLSGLDLVISTETAIPNLSGAMGIPTCILAAVDHDWRWRHWYPGITICDQDVAGDWSGAVEKAMRAVAGRRREVRQAA